MESLSAGNGAAARRVLREINPADETLAGVQASHIVVEELATRLRQRGFAVDRDVGQSGFRCDLAVRSSDRRRYCLGIMLDTESYYQHEDLLERDLLRPRLLRNFDWTVVLVLTKDWLENADSVMERLVPQIAETASPFTLATE